MSAPRAGGARSAGLTRGGLRTAIAAGVVLIAAGACKKQTPQVVYQAVPVERRDIIVNAQAAGAIQADTTVEVKSKASGEVLQLNAETGQLIKRGTLLVHIDPRNARNALAQAQANLTVAQAKLTNATSQKRRADELFTTQAITQEEHETALLDYADAQSQVVNARVAVDNAKIQLEDTDVRAPVTGTIIELDIERGTVIASATSNVSGGTTLLKMANLDLIQVNTLVDETDVGKVQPGQDATVTVDAFPNRTFDGSVLKIEPQAQVQQNVTVFPVLVRIHNENGLLRPGMNTEVEIHVGQRDSVLAVPNAALRTQRDVASAAGVLGLSPDDVQQQLAATAGQAGSSAGASPRMGAEGGAGDSAATGARDTTQRRAGDTTRPFARDSARGGARSAGTGAQERRGVGGQSGGGGERAFGGQRGAGGLRRSRGTDASGGRYIVFVKRNGRPAPVWIRTGLTDLDYSEVVHGLAQGDSVYILPSASLVQSQQDLKQRVNQITGGGGVPGMRQTTPAGGARTAPGR
ncbi:MAG TPA: efflux RND transporter periplasmic adaptor subunit [Gemmatimonadales bacterium]|nr:efflux RND transporter periplasmic adaptor subunit [Gemmatimonadales bacterium]